jgi:hypothetical protein
MAEEERSSTASEVDDAAAADLSDAARGVVRQSADPRLDAHLARMFSDPDAERDRRGRADESLVAEVESLREELAVARSEADGSRRLVRTLTVLVMVGAITIVVLLILLEFR